MGYYTVVKNAWTTASYIKIEELQKHNYKQNYQGRDSTCSMIPFVWVLETGQTK